MNHRHHRQALSVCLRGSGYNYFELATSTTLLLLQRILLIFLLFFTLTAMLMVSESTALSQESLKELSRLPHMRNHWLVVQHRKQLQQQQQRIGNSSSTGAVNSRLQQLTTTTTPSVQALLNNNNTINDTNSSSVITITQQPPPFTTEMMQPHLMPSSSEEENEEVEQLILEDVEEETDSERGDDRLRQRHQSFTSSATIKPKTATTTTTTTTTTTEATSMSEKEKQQQQVVSSISSSLSLSQAKEKLKARRNKSRKKATAISSTSSDDTWNKQQQQPDQNQQQTPPPPSSSSSGNNRKGEESDAVEAKKHIIRMQQSGASCSQPSPRLVYVRHSNVRYLPECTWLHRCSDDIGCCPDESQTCSPANIQSVSLPFFALTMVGHETRRTVTRLTFENHTSCECVGRNADLMPRTEPDQSSASLQLPPHSQHHRQHHHRHHIIKESTSSRNDRQQQPSTRFIPIKRLLRQHKMRPSAAAVVTQCRCPSGYYDNEYSSIGRRHRHKRHCVCQCRHSVNGDSSGRKCTQTSRGLDTFSPRDQRCINSKRCQMPQCIHGRYIQSLGRCPLAAKS